MLKAHRADSSNASSAEALSRAQVETIFKILNAELGVQSRHLMDRIWGEPFGFDCPLFADELVGSETFEGLQSSPEVIGAIEVVDVISQLVLVVLVETFDGRVVDGAVHALDLAASRENSPLGAVEKA